MAGAEGDGMSSLRFWLYKHNYPLMVVEWIRDYLHHRSGKPPLWPDAEPCGRRYCRYCGGEA